MSMGFSLAAIETGTMCFCKSSTTINSQPISDSNCQTNTCPGDATLYCGSFGYLMIYQAGSSARV